MAWPVALQARSSPLFPDPAASVRTTQKACTNLRLLISFSYSASSTFFGLQSFLLLSFSVNSLTLAPGAINTLSFINHSINDCLQTEQGNQRLGRKGRKRRRTTHCHGDSQRNKRRLAGLAALAPGWSPFAGHFSVVIPVPEQLSSWRHYQLSPYTCASYGRPR